MSIRDNDLKYVPEPTVKDSCWRHKGILGDKSCTDLPQYIHCHNCPVYTGSALRLFDRSMPADYRDQWTSAIARQKEEASPLSLSVVSFRVNGEWLALATGVVAEIIEPRTMHSIPHRSDHILRGMVNIHGGLQLCFSMKDLVGINNEAGPVDLRDQKVFDRMVLIEWQKKRWVFAADEVYGILHFEQSAIKQPPETLTRSHEAFTRGVLPWRGDEIGWLDHELLFSALDRHIR